MLKPKVRVYFFGLVCMAAVALGWSQTASIHGLASDRIPLERMKEYSDLAVRWQREYLRIDTTNPPGNEALAADFFKKILDREGIENRVFSYAAGRADLWARIPKNTSSTLRPIILLNHMDVVTSAASHWRVPPFDGQVVDGSIYGRGAQDMKNEGLAQFMVMVMLQREKVELERDVIFLAVSDEEVDGTGSDWFIEHERDLLGKWVVGGRMQRCNFMQRAERRSHEKRYRLEVPDVDLRSRTVGVGRRTRRHPQLISGRKLTN